MEIKREHHINFWYVIIAFLGILFVQDLLIRQGTVKTIPYSEFQTLLQQQKLMDIVVGPATITGKFKEPADAAAPNFSTTRVDAALVPALTQAGTTFSGEPGPGIFSTVLGWFMPAIGFFLLWMLLIRPMVSA
jgi:cell division protease FtsH